MRETLRAQAESNDNAEKKQLLLAHELRVQAQSLVRKERPADIPRRELFGTKPRVTAEGVKLSLVEDWQSPEISDTPELHDKRVHLVALVDLMDDAGVVHRIPETLATFHDLQPFDSDGETLGYASTTLAERVTLQDVGTLLMAFENPAQATVAANNPRNVGGLALQNAQ